VKVKFVGESFGVESLTSDVTYECLGIEAEYIRVIDDSEEDYLYSIRNPRPLTVPFGEWNGKWEIVEDDEAGTLAKALGTGG
jgi:hypothetical protein